MDIQSEKLQMIEWVVQLNDEKLIKKLVAFKADVKRTEGMKSVKKR